MNEDADRINLSVSGWPGSGGTTLSMILSYTFNRKYLYIGNVYRYLGSKLGFSEKGINRPQFDEYIEDIIGKTTDRYIDFKLLNSDLILLDSDITVFRIGRHPKVFSIFLSTPFEQRKERLSSNKIEMDYLDERDIVLKKKYEQLWGIDFFDIDTINLKHNLVIDNSNMSLKSEFKLIVDKIKEYGSFSQLQQSEWEGIIEKGNTIIDLFNEKGKDKIIKELKKIDLFFEPQVIIKEITSLFPEDVSTFPDHIKKLFFLKI